MKPIWLEHDAYSKEVALLSHYTKAHGRTTDLSELFYNNTIYEIMQAELPTLDWQSREAMLCLAKHIKNRPRSELIAFQMDEFCDIYKLGVDGKCTSEDLTKDGFKLCFDVMARVKALFPEDVKYLVSDVLEKEMGYLDVVKSSKPSHDDVPSLVNDIAEVRIMPDGWRYIDEKQRDTNLKDEKNLLKVTGGGYMGQAKLGNDVFIVHGQDDSAKNAVALFITRIGMNPIILHEQSGGSKTIIEKIEAHSNVGFAAVIMTPDDEGRQKGKDEELTPRARQNVVLELGYFIGKLGRERVCVLLKEGVEKPSDVDGIEYVPFDANGGWKIKVAQELRMAGFNVDMSKIK